MSKNTSVSLGDHFNNFIEAQVSQGGYASASDVVRAGLRLLENQEAKLEALRAALMEGEDSGPSTPFDLDVFVARKGVSAKFVEDAVKWRMLDRTIAEARAKFADMAPEELEALIEEAFDTVRKENMQTTG
jgi:antitoxin ParD1/3/4